MQATKHVPGQQEDEVTTYGPGHWFGETVFEKDQVIWYVPLVNLVKF